MNVVPTRKEAIQIEWIIMMQSFNFYGFNFVLHLQFLHHLLYLINFKPLIKLLIVKLQNGMEKP